MFVHFLSTLFFFFPQKKIFSCRSTGRVSALLSTPRERLRESVGRRRRRKSLPLIFYLFIYFFSPPLPCMKSNGNHGNLALYRTELRRLKLSSARRGALSITLTSALWHAHKQHTHTRLPALSSVHVTSQARDHDIFLFIWGGKKPLRAPVSSGWIWMQKNTHDRGWKKKSVFEDVKTNPSINKERKKEKKNLENIISQFLFLLYRLFMFLNCNRRTPSLFFVQHLKKKKNLVRKFSAEIYGLAMNKVEQWCNESLHEWIGNWKTNKQRTGKFVFGS